MENESEIALSLCHVSAIVVTPIVFQLFPSVSNFMVRVRHLY